MATNPLEDEHEEEQRQRDKVMHAFRILPQREVPSARAHLTLWHVALLVIVGGTLGVTPLPYSVIGVVALMLFVATLR